MNFINTISAQRFSLDGIDYFKNFLSKVNGNNITIYNAYDSKNVLVEATIFSQITLNGIVHTSVAALQSALLPIIYTRNSLNGLVTQSPLFNYFSNITGFTLVGQNLTINAGWAWFIEGTSYSNPASVVLNIPFAVAGKKRIDIVVANTNNTFELIQGIEVLVANTPAEPIVPIGMIKTTTLIVNDSTGGISSPVIPVPGSGTGSGIDHSKGNYDALNNVPVLVNGSGVRGDYYTVTVAGTKFGFDFKINDRIEYNGADWIKVINNTTSNIEQVLASGNNSTREDALYHIRLRSNLNDGLGNIIDTYLNSNSLEYSHSDGSQSYIGLFGFINKSSDTRSAFLDYEQGLRLNTNGFGTGHIQGSFLTKNVEAQICNESGTLAIFSNGLLAPPTSINDLGAKGEIRFSGTHVYFCVDTNTWYRVLRDISAWS